MKKRIRVSPLFLVVTISMICLVGILLVLWPWQTWKIKTQEQSLEKLPIYYEKIEIVLDKHLETYEKEEIHNYILNKDEDGWQHHIRNLYFFNDYILDIRLSSRSWGGEYVLIFDSIKYENINDVKKIPAEYIELLNDVGLVCCTKDALGPGAKKFLELEEKIYSNKDNFIGGESISERYLWDHNPLYEYSYRIKYQENFYYSHLSLSEIPMKNLVYKKKVN